MSRYDEWAAHLDPEMPDNQLNDDEYEALDRISAALGDEALWDGPPPSLRDRILAQAAAEVTTDEGPTVISVGSRAGSAGARARARWLIPAFTAVAAAFAVFAFLAWPRSVTESFDLAGTELAPNARAGIEVENKGAGTAFTLTITGLPPAADGEYYAAWLTGDSGAVPLGSFHWREGGVPIELWGGVDTERYPNIAVTLQQEGEPTTSSGLAVLQGRIVDP